MVYDLVEVTMIRDRYFEQAMSQKNRVQYTQGL